MKVNKTLHLDNETNWEEFSHDTLRNALKNHIHVDTIHVRGKEVMLEGTHSFPDPNSGLL